MHIIHHFVKTLDHVDNPGLLSAIHRYRSQWENVNEKIASYLLEKYTFENATILTHSRSGTFQEVMKLIGPIVKVFQTQSIPGMEGVLQAEDLKNWGLQVQLIQDTEVVNVIDEIDYCIIGCDQFDEHHIVNKVVVRN